MRRQKENAAEMEREDKILVLHDSKLGKRNAAFRPQPLDCYDATTHLLRPFLHLLTGTVLDIGDDPGDVPCALASSAERVIAVRSDASSASAVSSRCRTLPNVTVLTRDLFQLLKPAAFDAVVILDLPTCSLHPRSQVGEEPLTGVLAHARSYLKSGGILVAAVENRLGLRQFAGYDEINGVPFSHSLEGRVRPDGFVLPGREELTAALRRIGLGHQDWWFPFPDHRAPLTLIAERSITGGDSWDINALLSATAPFDPRLPPHPHFSVQRAWAAVIKNGLVADLANAFLVASSDRQIATTNTLALHYGHRRRSEFEKQVTFEHVEGSVRVRRQPLYPSRRQCIDGVSNQFPSESLRAGTIWTAGLQTILSREGWTIADVTVWVDIWCRKVRDAYAPETALLLQTQLPGSAIDAIPRNLIFDGSTGHFVDLEWDYGESISFGWLFMRGLVNALDEMQDCELPISGVPTNILDIVVQVGAALGWTITRELLQNFLDQESRLQSIVSNTTIVMTIAAFSSRRIKLRSCMRKEFIRVESARAEATAAHQRLSAEHEMLKQRLAQAEDDALRVRLRYEREIEGSRVRELVLLEAKGRLSEDLARSRACERSRSTGWLDRVRRVIRGPA